ncbi:MAG: site-2 protease family protein, partial [Anaerolineae bacterium]|nr:site-2 protease family protein [Anaerolineae bacterium]
MESNIKLGRMWGVPIGLHTSWFLIFGLVTFSLAAGYFPAEYDNLPVGAYWLLAALTAVLFFASVLAHELGHVWMALRERVPVRGVTLFMFGGVAQIEEEPRTPGGEFRIAIAGPLVSLSLALLFEVVYLLDRGVSPYLAAPSLWLARINLILAVFNMIPGFPLDGGRVLRAIIWKITGSQARATRIAGGVGQVVAVGFMGLGVLEILAGGMINGLWLIFIGWFLQNAA